MDARALIGRSIFILYSPYIVSNQLFSNVRSHGRLMEKNERSKCKGGVKNYTDIKDKKIRK